MDFCISQWWFSLLSIIEVSIPFKALEQVWCGCPLTQLCHQQQLQEERLATLGGGVCHSKVSMQAFKIQIQWICYWKTVGFLLLLIWLHHQWCLATGAKEICRIKSVLPLTSLKFNARGSAPTEANYKNHPSLTLIDVLLTNSPHTVLWTRLFA